METFYATLSSICFTLVGLWWVVVQFKYDLFMSSPSLRVAAYVATMHFIAPGVISLVSVLVSQEAAIWRVGSFAGSALGIVASFAALRSGKLAGSQRLIEVALLILFGVLAVLSFVTVPIFGLKPIMVESLVDVLVIVLGVQYAWQFFAGDALKPGM
jgi:hypothetical protein